MENQNNASYYVRPVLSSGFLVRYCEKNIRNDWELHYHNELEIYYLVEGKCKVFIDNKVYEFRAGDMAIVPPGILHKVCYEKDGPVTRFIVNCNFGMLPQKVVDKCLSIGGYIPRIPGAYTDIEGLLFKMKKEYDTKDEMYTEMMRSYATMFVTLVSRTGKKKETIEIKSQKKVIEMAVAYVKENFSGNVSLCNIVK